MTIEELENMDSNVLTVKQVAQFLGKDPQIIRDQAEREPKYLGFPICKAGHSFSIPRIGFLNWYKGMTPVLVWGGDGVCLWEKEKTADGNQRSNQR